MSPVLNITLPIFLLILAGYGAVRLRWIAQADCRALGFFVLRFALPALVFNALARRSLSEIVEARALAAYAGASLAVFAALFAVNAALHPGRRAANAMQAFGGASSNSGFVGFPLAFLTLGEVAGVGLALCMIVENALIIPLSLALAESEQGAARGFAANVGAALRRLAVNPLILAIVFGLLAAAARVAPPAPIGKAVDMLASASAATSLFSIGGMLVGLRLGEAPGDVARIVFGKLILHPLAVFVALSMVGGVAANLQRALVIFAAAPMLGVYPLLCRPFGQERTGAAALLAATALSFVTLSALLLLLGS